MGPPGSTPTPADDGPVVFYNGACPACRRENDHYRRYGALRNLPLRWTDVTADPGVLAARGVDPETQRRRMPRFGWLGALLRGRAVRAAAHVAYDRVLAAAPYRWDRRRRRREGGVDLPHDHPT